MGGIGQARRGQPHAFAIALRLTGDPGDARRAGQGRGFQADALAALEQGEQAEQLVVVHRVVAVEQALHGAADEARRTPHRQAIGGGAVVDAEVLHRNLLVAAGIDAEEHAGRMGRLGEQAVHRVAERQLEAEGHPAGTAADPAGQMDEQRVLAVDADAGGVQLAAQSLGGDGVAEEQVAGVFVVDEMGVGIAGRFAAALFHRDTVVGGVLHHRHAVGAQLVLLPLAGVGGHVHAGLEAQRGADDADGKAQVAGGAHRYPVAGEECPAIRLGQPRVVVVEADQAVLEARRSAWASTS